MRMLHRKKEADKNTNRINMKKNDRNEQGGDIGVLTVGGLNFF